MNNAERIKRKALELGFDLAGVTSAEPMSKEEIEIFQKWLDSGYAGQMQYMHRNLDKRTNPVKLLDNAKSVIVVGLNYKLEETWPKSPTAGRVARYARFTDYHIFVKNILRKLAEYIINEIDENAGFKICVDSVPLAERAFAARAGLGFIGKNHMLINPRLGPEIFLGELITTAQLEADSPMESKCTGCDACIKACPTGALRADGRFDARKCISYLTIEHKGQIESELSGKIDNRVFGCDECVLACPYMQKAPLCQNTSFRYYPERTGLELDDIVNMTAEQFEAAFAGSPLYRTGLDALKRNARICLENSKL